MEHLVTGDVEEGNSTGLGKTRRRRRRGNNEGMIRQRGESDISPQYFCIWEITRICGQISQTYVRTFAAAHYPRSYFGYGSC